MKATTREDFVDHLRRLSVLGVLPGMIWGAFVLWPVFGHADRSPGPQPLRIEGQSLDFYILRDGSMSPDANEYAALEDRIISTIHDRAGDRFSYARFGDGTEPPRIPTASTSRPALEAIRTDRQAARFTRTDFAHLFDKLGEAIKEDRESAALDGGRSELHVDLAVVLSDGVHDTRRHNLECAHEVEALNEPFIPEAVVQSFARLKERSRRLGGALEVTLVLAGGRADCAPRIKDLWRIKLGSLGLRVLNLHEPRDQQAFESLAHIRDVSALGLFGAPVVEWLGSDQRDALEDRGDFTALYRFRSIRTGGVVQLQVAELFEAESAGKEEARPVEKFHVTTLEGDRDVVLPQPSKDLESQVQDRTLRFVIDHSYSFRESIDPGRIYLLRLDAEAKDAGSQMMPPTTPVPDLLIPPSARGLRRMVLDRRLQATRPALICFVALLMIVPVRAGYEWAIRRRENVAKAWLSAARGPAIFVLAGFLVAYVVLAGFTSASWTIVQSVSVVCLGAEVISRRIRRTGDESFLLQLLSRGWELLAPFLFV